MCSRSPVLCEPGTLPPHTSWSYGGLRGAFDDVGAFCDPPTLPGDPAPSYQPLSAAFIRPVWCWGCSFSTNTRLSTGVCACAGSRLWARAYMHIPALPTGGPSGFRQNPLPHSSLFTSALVLNYFPTPHLVLSFSSRKNCQPVFGKAVELAKKSLLKCKEKGRQPHCKPR